MPRAHIRASNNLFVFDKEGSYEAEATVPNLCQGTMPLSRALNQFCSSSLLWLNYLTYSRAESGSFGSVYEAQSQSHVATHKVITYAKNVAVNTAV